MNINDRTAEFDQDDIIKNKTVSALAYLGILFFLPLVSCPDSRFGRFHANQGLLLLLLAVAGNIIGIIPFIGWIAAAVVNLAVFVLFILGLVNALNGQAKELPFIGSIQIIR